jgi:hypothetical protein
MSQGHDPQTGEHLRDLLIEYAWSREPDDLGAVVGVEFPAGFAAWMCAHHPQDAAVVFTPLEGSRGWHVAWQPPDGV